MSRPVRNRSSVNGALMRCGSPVATIWAKTWPEPGVALKPPVPQPQLTNRPRHRRLADDRRAVGRDVDDAAPVAQHAQAPHHGKELADRVERVGRDVQPAGLAVGHVGVGTGADHQFALVGLGHVGVDGVRHHDAGHDGLDGFRDQRLQGIALERQPHVGHAITTRGVAGRHDTDAAGLDLAAGRVEAGDARGGRGGCPLTSQFWMMSTPSASAARA